MHSDRDYATSDEDIDDCDLSDSDSSDNEDLSLSLNTDSDDDDDGTAGDGMSGDSWVPLDENNNAPPVITFSGPTGLIRPPGPDSPPIEYVKLFINNDLVTNICYQTNLYAHQWICSHEQYLRDKKRSAVHLWIKQGKTFDKEFLVFLGVLLNMGLVRKPTISSYWDCTNPSQMTTWFVEHFGRERFELLLKFLHFADNEEMPGIRDPSYRLYKIQPLIDHFIQTFTRHYYPKKNISIDESMIGFRGKTPLLQIYMPNKHHARFSLKVWCLCEASTGYTVTFEIYKGATGAPVSADGITHDLVLRLLNQADVRYRGHHLGLDNYFTSPKLFSDLWDRNTTATGTVRRNKKGLPMDALKEKLPNHGVSERRKGPLLCVAYRDGKKTPVLLSTTAKGGYEAVHRRGKADKRLPSIVADYNNVMGGVDLKDTQLYTYLSERRTMKWTAKAALSLIGTAILNSYLLYKKNTSSAHPMTRYKFMISVIEALVKDYRPVKIIRKRRTAEQIRASNASPLPIVGPSHVAVLGDDEHDLVKLPVGKKRDCVMNHGRRVRTCFMCPKCDVGICPQCYPSFHKRLRK